MRTRGILSLFNNIVLRFYPSEVKKMIERVLTEKLHDCTYDAEVAGELTEELVRMLRDAAKCNTKTFYMSNFKIEIPMCRYKLLFQVVLGEFKGQGLKITSKSLWDVEFDNYASYTFKNVRNRYE